MRLASRPVGSDLEDPRPRRPRRADCVSLALSGATLVYPDPPLGCDLRELIDALRPHHLRVVSLSELGTAR